MQSIHVAPVAMFRLWASNTIRPHLSRAAATGWLHPHLHHYSSASPTQAKAQAPESKFVLLPVACVGAGKSTLGTVLQAHLRDSLAHVQNDDIRNKRRDADGRRPFDKLVVGALATHPIVYADRNNHTIELRMELVESVRQAYPQAKVVYVVWPLDEEERDRVYEEVLRRIHERGERHQSLTPGKTPELERVVGRFVYKRDEVYADEIAWAAGNEGRLAQYVRMDVFAEPGQNAKALAGALRQLDGDRSSEWERVARAASGFKSSRCC